MPERTFKESFKVAADQLLGSVTRLIHEGNVRRVILKQDGRTVVEFPLTVGVVGTVLAPVLAAVGAIAAVLTGDWLTLIAVALVFGIVNAVVRPVTKLVTFPFIILTLGLFLFVINGLMLMLTSALSGWLGLGFAVRGFGAAFWGALVVSLVSWVVSLAVRERDERVTD